MMRPGFRSRVFAKANPVILLGLLEEHACFSIPLPEKLTAGLTITQTHLATGEFKIGWNLIVAPAGGSRTGRQAQD